MWVVVIPGLRMIQKSTEQTRLIVLKNNIFIINKTKLKKFNHWLMLNGYKALVINTLRIRSNYYVFINNYKKHLWFQCSAGIYKYDLKQRFTNAALLNIYLLCYEFIVRTKQTLVILRITNIQYAIRILIQLFIKRQYISLLWVEELRVFSFNGCRLPNPRRR